MHCMITDIIRERKQYLGMCVIFNQHHVSSTPYEKIQLNALYLAYLFNMWEVVLKTVKVSALHSGSKGPLQVHVCTLCPVNCHL